MARYQLRVQVSLEKLDEQGRPMYSGGQFALEERATIEADGWVGVTDTLKQFDQLIKDLDPTRSMLFDATNADRSDLGSPDRGVTEH